MYVHIASISFHIFEMTMRIESSVVGSPSHTDPTIATAVATSQIMGRADCWVCQNYTGGLSADDVIGKAMELRDFWAPTVWWQLD